MSIEEKKSLTCSKCNEENDPGMLFCIFCGQGLTASAEKMRSSNTVVMGGKCPTCGKEDELNMRFCIFCSAPIYPDLHQQRPIDKFSWEMELVDDTKPKTTAAVDFKKAVQKSPTKQPLNLLPIGLAVGAILGGLCMVPTPVSNLMLRTWLSGDWPAKSLTIYTKHPFAQVTLYQPSDGKIFTLAETDTTGAVRFSNLEAADYNLKISGKGLRTAFTQVKVDALKPTVLGYGQDGLIELDKDSAAPDSSAVQPQPQAPAESKPQSPIESIKAQGATESTKPQGPTESTKPQPSTESTKPKPSTESAKPQI